MDNQRVDVLKFLCDHLYDEDQEFDNNLSMIQNIREILYEDIYLPLCRSAVNLDELTELIRRVVYPDESINIPDIPRVGIPIGFQTVTGDTESLVHYIADDPNSSIVKNSTLPYFTNIDVTNIILENLNLDSSRLEFVSDRPGHDFKYAVDITKLTSMGWVPKYNFEEVIPEIVQWYVDNIDWWNEEYQNVQKKRKLRKTLI